MPPPRPIKSAVASKPRWQWYQYSGALGFLLVLVILASGGFFILKPQIDSIFQLQSDTEHIQAEYQTKTKLRDGIDAFIKNAGSLSGEQRGSLEYMLPKTGDLPGLFAQMEQLTQSSGMGLRSMQAADTGQKSNSTPAGVLTLPFTIAYETSQSNPYQILKQSLATFESNLRLLDVAGFTFDVRQQQDQQSADSSNTSTENAGKAKQKMELKMSTYYFPE